MKPVKDIYRTFIDNVTAIKEMFVDRDDMIDGIALALLCKQHLFVLSPPGTAKTAIIQKLADAFTMKFFGVQMRDDTKVEEVLGMWDLKALEQGKYSRRWGRLAVAEIGYINEAFKGSSNALNAMLGLLHERQTDDDDGYHEVPLWTAILDSNELPRDRKALAAFFDRIIFKKFVDYISESDKMRKLLEGGAKPKPINPLTRAELNALHEATKKVKLHSGYVDQVIAIRALLQMEGIVISDRTMAESCGVAWPDGTPRVTPVKASACYRGRATTTPRDLLVLEDVFWIDPAERAKVRSVIFKCTMPDAVKAEAIVDRVLDLYHATMSGRVQGNKAVMPYSNAPQYRGPRAPKSTPPPEENGGRQGLSEAMSQILSAKRELEALTGVDDDLMAEYLKKVLWCHAQVSSLIMGV